MKRVLNNGKRTKCMPKVRGRILPKAHWKAYEAVTKHVAAYLKLSDAIDSVEGKHSVMGESGAKWEIDGKVLLTNGGFLVIEARRHTRDGLNQEAVAAIAYRIKDLKAEGAIVISPKPLQRGAILVAQHNNICHVNLRDWSTSETHMASFLNQWITGNSLGANIEESLRVTQIDKSGAEAVLLHIDSRQA